MLEVVARRQGWTSIGLMVFSIAIEVLSDVIFCEPDGSSTDADAVVRDSLCFDELVDAGLADVQSPGDVFNGEQHGWMAFDSSDDRKTLKNGRQLEVRELPAVERIGGLSP